MERVKKWMKMLGKWEDKKTKEVLHRRIYKGIPNKLRARVSYHTFHYVFVQLAIATNKWSIPFIFRLSGMDKTIGYRKNGRKEQRCVSKNAEIGTSMEHRSTSNRF